MSTTQNLLTAGGGLLGSFFGPGGTLVGGALGGALGGFLGNRGGPTPIQQTQQNLIDQLLASLGGEGPFADLFSADEATFNRTIGDPSRERFRSRIAPQIQESFIASGQQRGTGLEDTLTRAGVDLNSLLDQQFGQFQQQAQNRQANAISGILGQGAGVQPELSGGQAALQGLAGFASSPQFGTGIENLFAPKSKGFEKDQFQTLETI